MLDSDQPLREPVTSLESGKVGEISNWRHEFIIPSLSDLKTQGSSHAEGSLPTSTSTGCQEAVYLCGNSLGLQPKRTASLVSEHLHTWATQGVHGHFKLLDNARLAPFLHADDQAAELMAPLVGAQSDEIAVMETLTANLHLMMASFYQPTKQRYKILIEAKAFPSDIYAVSSQVIMHGFDPSVAIILLEAEEKSATVISTSRVKSIIDAHASELALILLPGVQYYSGQLFDIKTITSHAHSHDVVIGWDLAHAVGNVPLSLHDWNVDFAVWCNYKYVNAGPGAVASLFVHERHGEVHASESEQASAVALSYRPRLAGWWGGEKRSRFKMAPNFEPARGAKGFQVGNPSALAISALIGALEVFHLVPMEKLREKSVVLTQFLVDGLMSMSDWPTNKPLPYQIITPLDPQQRGAQISVKLQPGLMETVIAALESAGIVVDERQPDVIRVAPVPLYNTIKDVQKFVDVFRATCKSAGQRT